jgi:hypothetical protein
MSLSIDLFIYKSGEKRTIPGDITFHEAKASAVIHGALSNPLSISRNGCQSLSEHAISNSGGNQVIGRPTYYIHLNLEHLF